MISMKRVAALALATAFAMPVIAQTIDGNLASGEYSAAIVSQNQNSGFGDQTGTPGSFTGGSELDAAYGFISGGNLHLFLSGNLERNGNTLDLFFDTGLGGQNRIATGAGYSSTGVMVPFAGAAGAPGMTLSTGFNASALLSLTATATAVNVVGSTQSGTSWSDFNLGTGMNNDDGSHPGGTLTGSSSVKIALNDTNVGGVDGTGHTAANTTNALAVNKGFEFLIPLAFLGNPSATSIKIIAGINGGSNGYYSNQFLSGLSGNPTGGGNLGGDGAGNYVAGSVSGINLSTFGNPQFTVNTQAVPEPMTMLALGLGVVGLARKRRSK